MGQSAVSRQPVRHRLEMGSQKKPAPQPVASCVQSSGSTVQRPRLQTSPWPQVRPQAPQFSRSAERSRQLPLHEVSVPAQGLGVPASMETPASVVPPSITPPSVPGAPPSVVPPPVVPLSALVPPPMPPAEPPPWLKVCGTHRPRLHESVKLHVAQAAPIAPQAWTVWPVRQAPAESQQPVQVDGPQGGLAVSGHAVSASEAAERRTSENERMAA